ncbi:MAG TPA: YlmC/YmxH family sporulation protein [Candidatus Butyricicoccus stercorigallinarum]|nr:YlmC/YmxH family sporulation protein [Candidatus Butyricicoccus stercorigallinarum]
MRWEEKRRFEGQRCKSGCRIVDLRCKEVICIGDGSRLGFVSDVEIDTCTGRLVALVVPGRGRLSLLGRRADCVIPWEAIRRIGDDIILTSFCPQPCCPPPGREERRCD